ncbi:SNF2-related protein, partial (plasmid) [Chromobacterium amazonense]
RFAPSLRLRAYHQHRRLDDVGPGDLVVVSYGLLQREADAFGEVHWASVVLDEAQAIKNPQSQRAQVAQSLRADFRLAASGTPVENHLGELWSLFCFIAPGLLGNLAQFEQRYAQPIADGD